MLNCEIIHEIHVISIWKKSVPLHRLSFLTLHCAFIGSVNRYTIILIRLISLISFSYGLWIKT